LFVSPYLKSEKKLLAAQGAAHVWLDKYFYHIDLNVTLVLCWLEQGKVKVEDSQLRGSGFKPFPKLWMVVSKV
jgi:hypothetical protein